MSTSTRNGIEPRFAYNWALDEWQKQYETWKLDNTQPRPSQMALRRQLNAIKKEKFPWMLEVTKNAPQMAIIQLGQAFQNFFAGRAKYPKFRKKGVYDRFSLSNDQFSVDASRIRIPHLGWVRMRETLRFSGKIMSATVSRVADQWFVSITADTPDNLPLAQAEKQGAAGVDLGCLGTRNALNGRAAHPRPQGAQSLAVPLAKAFTQFEPKSQRLEKPAQSEDETGKAARPNQQHPQGCAAPAHH